MDLSVVILNYKSKDFLKKCLTSLEKACKHLKKNGFTYEVIVVENASGDDLKPLKKQKKLVTFKLIENKKNLGFSKGNNIGIKASKGRYVLLLNPDTVVEENTLTGMIKFMDNNPNVGLSTCYVELVKTGEIDWASHRGFPTPWASFTYYSKLSKIFPKTKLFGQYHQTWKDLNTIHEIDSPVGAFYLIRRRVLNQVGLLDEDYFMYAEDLDLAFRIKKAGYKVMYNPKFKIYHYKGVSSGIKKHTLKDSKNTLKNRKIITSYFYDTMIIFYKKHYAKKYPFFINWLVYFGIFLKKQISLRTLKV